MNAAELIPSVRAQLADSGTEGLGNRYLQAVEERRVELSQLRPFVGEQFHIVSSDLRSIAHMLSRFGSDLFVDLLDGERAALEALPELAAALGMTAEDLLDYEPTPGAQAYSAYTAWLAAYASEAEVAAAFAANFQAWSESCARLGWALRGRYGLGGGQVAFFELFGEPREDFEPRALQVVDAGLERGVPERLVRRAARMLHGYEAMFWDTLYETLSPASAPLPLPGEEGDPGE